MKKIIMTLTAVTFALGLAAAAQAQVAKTPEKPAVQSTQAVQPQVAPKAADHPVKHRRAFLRQVFMFLPIR